MFRRKERRFERTVFKSEDIRELQEKILWCVENRDRLREMGDQAYKVYETIFSVNAFEKKLLMYVREMDRGQADG